MEAENVEEKNEPSDEVFVETVETVEENVDFQSPFRRRKVLSRAKHTISAASKLLRQKYPCSGHLMTPRRLWLQSVPTQDCDVVITFPAGATDVTLMWLLSRFRSGSPGLVVHVKHHAASDSYAFYLTAPHHVLMKTAEELHLPKKVRREFGGGQREFLVHDAARFEGAEEEGTFFTTQERGFLVLHLLQTLRAGVGDEVGGLRLIEGQAIVPKCLSAGVIAQVFPLHEPEALNRLQRCWVRAFFNKQPLDQICEYFGVKIAMYFAWLGHYTTALIVPAVVGFVFWVFFCKGDQAREDVGFVIFSLFNVLWATVYLETWKRYSAELAYRWGTLDQRDELIVEPRPLFTGELEKSAVTGRMEPSYPAWKRNVFRYLVSVPVIASSLAVVFVVMFLILELQEWWDGKLRTRGYPFFLSYLPKILLAVVITVLDEIYHRVALWLNDMENFRTEEQYQNNFVVKLVMFQFVNSFLSLFYIAFYLQDQEKLKEQLAALLIARQVIGNIKESAIPYVLEQLRLAKLSFDLFGALTPTEEKKKDIGEAAGQVDTAQTEESINSKEEVGSAETPAEVEEDPSKQQAAGRNLSQAELEGTLFKYDGTFEDHLEMFIQFGYVVLFSSAFPMAGLCALLNNFIEIRTDAFKLCFVFQRPFGQRVPNIGTWQDAMEVMGLIAVGVNCALIGLSGQVHRMFPEMSTTQTILLIVILEHIMLILRFAISYAIPDLPDWVAAEMAKVEYSRREALRHSSSATHTPPPDQATAEADAALVIGRSVVTSSKTSSVSDEVTVIRQKSPGFVVSPAAAQKQDTPETEKSLGTPDRGSTQASTPASSEPQVGKEGGEEQPFTSLTPVTPATPVTPPRDPTPSSSESSDHDKSPKGALKKSSEWFDEHLEGRNKREAFPPLSAHIMNHHLTIGPHGGIDWVRRLGLETSQVRKSVNGSHLEIGSLPDARRAGSSGVADEGAASIRHSTDCIVAPKDLSASSDSDLLRSAPPWAQQRSKFRFSPDKDKGRTDSSRVLSSSARVAASTPSSAASTSNPEVRRPSAPSSSHQTRLAIEEARPRSGTDTSSPSPVTSSSGVGSGGARPRTALEPSSLQLTPTPTITTSSGEAAAAASTSTAATTAEELAAKKSRVKSSLLKRARSVAIFSLKLKERRARDAMAKETKPSPSAVKPPMVTAHWTGRNPDRVEGELSCIPIEKLISMDDVAVELMRKKSNT